VIALTQKGQQGPIHELPDGRVSQSVTRCGVKVGKYISSRWWDGEPDEVTCARCVALAAKGKRRAWKA
jgi:hypothetical protein